MSIKAPLVSVDYKVVPSCMWTMDKHRHRNLGNRCTANIGLVGIVEYRLLRDGQQVKEYGVGHRTLARYVFIDNFKTLS